MKFIDEVKIQLKSGKGGDGRVGFRREKFVPYGGPDGGNGGTGGSIYFEGDENVNTLVKFRGRKVYPAEDGEGGSGGEMHGKAGEDLIIYVPVGTLVFKDEPIIDEDAYLYEDQDPEEDEKDDDKKKKVVYVTPIFPDSQPGDLLVDITEHGQRVLISQGGRGGLGNTNFKSSTNQAPRHAQSGEQGEMLPLKLELKLIADIALVGLPNAGKSTLIATISSAKPKIADYPFTTLTPNLGVVKVDQDDSIVVADIPGLIEDAAEGKGLGIQFLKHIERTSALVHLIDCSMLLEPAEAIEDYATVRAELLKYSDRIAKKPEIICLTKTDAMTEEEIDRFQAEMENQTDKKVLVISSVTGKNLDILKRLMLKTKQQRLKEESNE